MECCTNEKVITRIPVSEDLRNYIQSLFYEVESRKNLLAFAISKDFKGTSSFDEYHKEYVEFTVQYDEACKQLMTECKVDEYPGCTWNLDFDACEVLING